MNLLVTPDPASRLAALPGAELPDLLGKRVSRVLSAGAEAVNPDVGERLRVARRQALDLARVRRLALIPSAAPSAGQGGRSLALGGGWWGRLGTLVPAVVLVLGLMGIQLWHQETLIQAAAEIDTALLADDAPPAAYADAGFIEFLREAPR